MTKNVYKITSHHGNNFYLIKDKMMLIDCGDILDQDDAIRDITSQIALSDIQKVIFTSLEHDKIGNFALFPNAKFYASSQAIEDFNDDPFSQIMSETLVDMFNVKLYPLVDNDVLDGLKIIWTPGHTRGAICLWYEDEGIMFTGETLLGMDAFSSLEMPTAQPLLYESSIEEIKKYPIKVLCPGREVNMW